MSGLQASHREEHCHPGVTFSGDLSPALLSSVPFITMLWFHPSGWLLSGISLSCEMVREDASLVPFTNPSEWEAFGSGSSHRTSAGWGSVHEEGTSLLLDDGEGRMHPAELPTVRGPIVRSSMAPQGDSAW